MRRSVFSSFFFLFFALIFFLSQQVAHVSVERESSDRIFHSKKVSLGQLKTISESSVKKVKHDKLFFVVGHFDQRGPFFEVNGPVLILNSSFMGQAEGRYYSRGPPVV